MHHSSWAESALDYRFCRYGQSRLLYRGPKKTFDNNTITFLGDSVTFGKFVGTPFADHVGEDLGKATVNLGSPNIGIDAILDDESLLSICKRSEITVLQIMGAANLSNRFYTVHPRRNDRFIQASPLMEEVFEGVDFMEFNFTHHMLAKLGRVSPKGYAQLVANLQETWVTRMRQLIDQLGGQVVLLWCAKHKPSAQAIAKEPFFVTQHMINSVKDKTLGFVKIPFSEEAKGFCPDGMHFLEHELEAAKRMPGPVAHREIARALVPILKNMA